MEISYNDISVRSRPGIELPSKSLRGVKGERGEKGEQGPAGPAGPRGPPGKIIEISNPVKPLVRVIKDGGTRNIYPDDEKIFLISSSSIELVPVKFKSVTIDNDDSYVDIPIVEIYTGDTDTKHSIRIDGTIYPLRQNRRYTLYLVGSTWRITS